MARIVARNRRDLERALSPITSELLKEKGYLCFVDIFMKLGYLSQVDYENWRLKRVPYLERVLTLNLPTINFVMKTVRRNSLNGHLKPRMTVYKSWGKGKKVLLQFSVVSLNVRDETHPNLGTGMPLHATDPGRPLRRGRTAMHGGSRHDRSALPPSPGSHGATYAANRIPA
jgi:hypothetical protein